jgi:filamentous hemagglutinin family protein
LPNVVVPNGLTAGGLQVAPNGGWSGANAPTQSASGGQVNVNINQTAPQAILNWTTFNVGANTAVNFNQQSSTWTALNRVIGNLGPSQILGQINAAGQVLVINQNGIIFGGASQINVGSLIASTAAITDSQFQASGIYSTISNHLYVPSFTGASGAVVVEGGAQISTFAPASATQGGGFVLLMGSEVVNAGSITTPKGQTELAAGDDFIVRTGLGTTSNQYSTTRGNEIAPVLYAGSQNGAVQNSGLVFSQQGDITLAGHTIVQDGVLISTTSVGQRGTIHLLNSASDATGSVTLTGNSFAAVLPEIGSTDTALNSQRDAPIANSAKGGNNASGQFDNLSTLADREDQSRIEIVSGGLVDFQSGSYTMAQGGQVAVSAGQRVFAAQGATIDVSGTTGAILPMSANVITVNVQGNELRDSSINRDSGTLFNDNVYIDARNLVLVPAGTGGDPTDRYYTAGGLLEVSGYINNTTHTIGEWTAVGGTITLFAPAVVTQAGSTFNISGGAINYAGGFVTTSNVIGSDGRRYSIGNVPSGVSVIGLAGDFTVNHPRWGVTEVYISPFGGPTSTYYESGYTVGRDAGTLSLLTPTAIFDGDILAGVITGDRQTAARPAGVTDGYKLTPTTVPQAGTLSLGLFASAGVASGTYPGEVTIDDTTGPLAAALSATGDIPVNLIGIGHFSASQLNQSGLGGLMIASGDQLLINAPLVLAPGATVNLTAADVDIAADITARSGSVSIGNVGTQSGTALTNSNGIAQMTLEPGTTIDTRGIWTNAQDGQGGHASLAFVNGGSISFDSSQGVTLSAGSVLDVSSGGALLPGGKSQSGRGGNITLIAGDPVYGSPAPLRLGGTLRAVGMSGGGTLKVVSQAVLIAAAGTTHDAGQLLLTPDFFTAGFATYDINGATGLTVAAGTQLNPVEPVYRLTPASYAAPSGSDPAAALQVWLPPLFIENPRTAQLTQRGGASLVLRSLAHDNGGVLTIGQGAAIGVDPGQSVELDGFAQVTVEGAISAHGGAITILAGAGTGTAEDVNFDASGNPLGHSIWIGDSAVLDVSGQAYTALSTFGSTYGTVQSGGSILIGGTGVTNSDGSLSSTSSFVVIRPGAVLDASGTSAVLTNITGTALARSQTPLNVASTGGSIAINSASGIYIDGTLRAASGGAGAAGGSLSIALETPNYGLPLTGLIPQEAQVPSIMTITQGPQVSGLPADYVPGGDPSLLAFGQATLSADAIAAGGFDRLALFARDVIQFDGRAEHQPLSGGAGGHQPLGRGEHRRALCAAGRAYPQLLCPNQQ